MWNRVDGMQLKNYRRNGVHKVAYWIDGERVSESAWKRRYIAALEAENEALHEKLAKIFDLI